MMERSYAYGVHTQQINDCRRDVLNQWKFDTRCGTGSDRYDPNSQSSPLMETPNTHSRANLDKNMDAWP